MYFQIAVNLICIFPYVNVMYFSIYIFVVNHIRFCIYLCLLLLSMTRFVCQFVSLCEVSESIVVITGPVFLFMSSSVQFDISSLLRNVTVTRQLCDFCDQYNRNLFQAITNDLGLCYQFCGVSVCLSFIIALKDIKFT